MVSLNESENRRRSSATSIALVANGSFRNSRAVSGVPYFLAQAMQELAIVVPINAYPNRPVRWLARALTFRRRRDRWDEVFLHGWLQAALRSAIRDLKLIGRSGDVRHVIHIRSWYFPSRLPYSAFIDATSTMLQGAAPKWTLPEVQQVKRRRREQRYYSGATKIFVASRAAFDSLTEHYDVPPQKIVLTGNGLNSFSGRSPSERSGPARKFLFVGKEVQRKGLDLLLEAMASVHESRPGITLTIAGVDQQQLPGWTRDASWIDVQGLIQDRDVLRDVYDAHDVLCLPARQEAFGLVALEAMSRGLACVVTNVGELPVNVRDGIEGRVITPEDGPGLATVIFELSDVSTDLRRMSASAITRAGAFSWLSISKQMLSTIGL
ncbi:glycosyltransferase family 4 protein [Curtobacterium sp. MCBD17_023]|uniref:glycosyltransferase family 4 protein n=1 Tax=Curtobacterium sp. MCBD17_023 TaxID=2175657 RepID=UPI000D9C5342|nr:glycosyltransferase family 4 protein [Curtobacterium sp. MCBD17_023]PYY48080.1 hypothetical protein DEI84_10350 [Curtobacterium sp. MCBD17_023]